MKRKKKSGASTDPTFPVSIDVDSLRRRIEEKAYMLFLKRGGQHGYDRDDWLEAERIVKEALAAEMRDPPHTDRVTNFLKPRPAMY